MNLSAIEDVLSVYEMQEIQAGSGFCTGFGAASTILGTIASCTSWNPVGWGGWCVIGGVNLYCAFR